jgi:spore coat polysaccharide biosynthesis protein SpsF (cytidylyltransferase family)
LSSKKNNKTVVAIIEARMGSSRLPGKVLADINGVPALDRLISRLKLCKYLDDIVIATTINQKDDEKNKTLAIFNSFCYSFCCNLSGL